MLDKNVRRIKIQAIEYVQGIFDSGYDGYSDDILIGGLCDGQIKLSPKFLLWNLDTLCHYMDISFNDSALGLGYVRFLLKLLDRGFFNKEEIKLTAAMYGFGTYVLKTYTTLNYDEREEIVEYLKEYRKNEEKD